MARGDGCFAEMGQILDDSLFFEGKGKNYLILGGAGDKM